MPLNMIIELYCCKVPLECVPHIVWVKCSIYLTPPKICKRTFDLTGVGDARNAYASKKVYSINILLWRVFQFWKPNSTLRRTMFMINTTASVKIEKSMKNSQEIGVGGSVVVARVGTGVFIAAGVPGKWKPSKHSYGSLIKVTFEAFYRGSRSNHKLRGAELWRLRIGDGRK